MNTFDETIVGIGADKVSYVSSSGIKNAAYTTDKISNQVSGQINNILNKIKNINSKCELHQKYNNTFASAKESFNHYIPGTTDRIEYIQVNWSTWKTTGSDTIIKELSNINNLLTDLSSMLIDIGILVDKSLISIENIDEYNKMINEALISGTAITDELLISSFEKLKDNITWDEYSAANKTWSGVKDENLKYWTDKPLIFEKDEKTGSYLIKQQDNNGNWIAMGWTNKETVLSYIATFKETDQKENEALVLPETLVGVGIDNTLGKNNLQNSQTETLKIDSQTLEKLKNKTNRTNVEDAIVNYYNELGSAEKSTVNDNMFATTTKVSDEHGTYYMTHIVIKDPSQIGVANGNGAYGNGLETTSSMAKKAGATIAINGSHFVGDGSQDLLSTGGTNNLAINNGKIKENWSSSAGMEICIDKNGKIFSPEPGTTAQQLVEMGVTNTFSSHDIPLIKNGEIQYGDGTSAWNNALNGSYNRTILAMKEPGEYYILTGNTTNLGAAEILKDQGCTYAKSLDQGGSTTLVYNDSIVNNPTDSTGERAVGDCLYFKS